jgi:hypothetical protein
MLVGLGIDHSRPHSLPVHGWTPVFRNEHVHRRRKVIGDAQLNQTTGVEENLPMAIRMQSN